MESTHLRFSRHQRERRRKEGKGSVLYVRYADDFVVLCNETKAEALAIKEELRGLLSTMGLTLSEEKTKVTHITEGFRFLGYQIIRQVGTKGKMAPKVLIPESAIKKCSHRVREIIAPSTTSESVSAKIIALNQLTRGWCHYYQCTSSPSWAFRKLNKELYWGMAHWLGKKYKISIPKVLRKFWRNNTFKTKANTLVLSNEYKAKRLLIRTWHNPYTAKEEIHHHTLFFF